MASSNSGGSTAGDYSALYTILFKNGKRVFSFLGSFYSRERQNDTSENSTAGTFTVNEDGSNKAETLQAFSDYLHRLFSTVEFQVYLKQFQDRWYVGGVPGIQFPLQGDPYLQYREGASQNIMANIPLENISSMLGVSESTVFHAGLAGLISAILFAGSRALEKGETVSFDLKATGDEEGDEEEPEFSVEVNAHGNDEDYDSAINALGHMDIVGEFGADVLKAMEERTRKKLIMQYTKETLDEGERRLKPALQRIFTGQKDRVISAKILKDANNRKTVIQQLFQKQEEIRLQDEIKHLGAAASEHKKAAETEEKIVEMEEELTLLQQARNGVSTAANSLVMGFAGGVLGRFADIDQDEYNDSFQAAFDDSPPPLPPPTIPTPLKITMEDKFGKGQRTFKDLVASVHKDRLQKRSDGLGGMTSFQSPVITTPIKEVPESKNELDKESKKGSKKQSQRSSTDVQEEQHRKLLTSKTLQQGLVSNFASLSNPAVVPPKSTSETPVVENNSSPSGETNKDSVVVNPNEEEVKEKTNPVSPSSSFSSPAAPVKPSSVNSKDNRGSTRLPYTASKRSPNVNAQRPKTSETNPPRDTLPSASPKKNPSRRVSFKDDTFILPTTPVEFGNVTPKNLSDVIRATSSPPLSSPSLSSPSPSFSPSSSSPPLLSTPPLLSSTPPPLEEIETYDPRLTPVEAILSESVSMPKLNKTLQNTTFVETVETLERLREVKKERNFCIQYLLQNRDKFDKVSYSAGIDVVEAYQNMLQPYPPSSVPAVVSPTYAWILADMTAVVEKFKGDKR